MSNKIHDFWVNTVASSRIDSHSIYKINELDKLPNRPGIYAWFLQIESSNYDEYFKLFKQKKIKVTIEGNLKDTYFGEAKATYNVKDYQSTSIDFDLCQVASLAFSPPLYIGISKDLKARLKTHASELEKIYYKKVALFTPPAVGKTDFDTIVESAHFAQRVGHSISSFSTVQLTSLVIRTIEMPVGYTWQELQKVEKYLNRTFNPVYGRK